MRPRWQRTTRRDAETVDVTAFLSLMVILVPFLLVTAVFSRMAILELQPIGSEGNAESVPDPLSLEVTLRQTAIEVSYSGLSEPTRIGRAAIGRAAIGRAAIGRAANGRAAKDRTADERAMASLAKLVSDLKSLHPQSQAATLRVEPQIPYYLLVQVLDVLRARPLRLKGGSNPESLFPLISLGPATVSEQSGAGIP